MSHPSETEASATVGRFRDAPTEKDIRLIFVTMLRPECARRFVESVRKFHPELPISFAEQTHGDGDLADLEASAIRLKVPFDIGLAASRNRLLDTIEEEFFLLADDDFYAVDRLPIDAAMEFLRANPDVVFVGGHVTDYFFSKEGEPKRVDARRDSNIAIDTTGQGVVLVPRSYVGGETREFDGEVFERCDYVANWGVGRTSFFRDTGFRWSETLKVGHEHIDFFLRLKLEHPDRKVFFFKNLAIDHHRHREFSEEYASFRRRDEYIELFGKQSGWRYLCDPVIGRVQFFEDFRTQVLFPRPERERAERDRQKMLEVRERYNELKARFLSLKESYAELKSKIASMKKQSA